MTYDILLQWRTPRFQAKTKWFRNIEASSLTEACNLVLAQQNYLCQSVSMCWPNPAPITDAEQAAWHAGIDEGRSQVRGAAQAAPSMDAKQLGDAVVKWLGCETTKPRGDTGEPERRIDVSVERLGFAVAAVLKTVTAPAPASGEASARALLMDVKARVNTLPALPAVERREYAIRIKQDIADFLAAPPAQEARVPLSDEQIDVIRFTWTNLPKAPTGRDDFVNIVRLIEKHHGITAAQKETP